MLKNTVIVDGSNIATEGRSTPSLNQLDEAVQAFITEHPTDHLVVVVDATFGHRIDASERPEFEEAILAGEIITPPAGAIGRGDAFILQIADKAEATVLSNDSFQELHGQYPWVFDEGRLIGGKPVPGLGWVFLLRTPVRGPISRKAVRDAKGPRSPSPSSSSGNGRRRGGRKEAAKGPVAKETPIKAGSGGDGGRGGRTKKPGEPLNDPLPFIEFVGAHPVGSAVKGEVVEFSSHGAYATVSGARCYVPLRLMGNPPPRSAREILKLGEKRVFVVYSLDPPRRGIDLALSSSVPDDESERQGSMKRAGVTRNDGGAREAESANRELDEVRAVDQANRKTNTDRSALGTTSEAEQHAEEAPVTPPRKAAPKRAAKKTTARKAAKRKAAPRKAAKKTTKRKAAPRKAAKKTTKRKAAPRKAAKKTTKRKAAPRKAAKKTTKRKAAPRKAAKKTTKRKAAPRKAAKRAPARKATKRKAPARRTAKKR